MEENDQKTYLHEDVEVVLTGRVAKRELRQGKVDERVEITPKDNTQGSWTKWVRRKELYDIE